ncbi:DUF6420 family protein [Streptomyces sp. Tu6071]|uniref:DUF6420 family protein n=1 Tax=Streptomyces sp. Tu6071 TaxID=355249 RepID=UPI001F36E77B|nr:DUF6420 family protein [Streptomyces sp. Tu6071]
MRVALHIGRPLALLPLRNGLNGALTRATDGTSPSTSPSAARSRNSRTLTSCTWPARRVTLDHLGCDAQTAPPKEEAFKRLALAAEGRCVLAGCTRRPRYSFDNVYRTFVARTAFVRSLLAIELGDIPFRDGEQLGKDWCALGTKVNFSPNRVLGHILATAATNNQGAPWLKDRFAGRVAPSTC